MPEIDTTTNRSNRPRRTNPASSIFANPAIFDAWCERVPRGLCNLYGRDEAVMYEHGWDAVVLGHGDYDHIYLLADVMRDIIRSDEYHDVATLEELRKIVKQMDLSLLRLIEYEGAAQ